jgi:hypothetical protein
MIVTLAGLYLACESDNKQTYRRTTGTKTWSSTTNTQPDPILSVSSDGLSTIELVLSICTQYWCVPFANPGHSTEAA